MVKYYGRARTRTGSVNTNQLGLKMSGCPSTVGKQGRIARYMGRRVDCMMGLCKPIRYHEVLWPRTRMRNQPPFCRAHATKCQAAAGGVGTNHNIPYYRIPKRGESGCTPAAVDAHPLTAALRLLQTYLTTKYGGAGSLILVAKKETLTSDHVDHPELFDQVKHFYPNTSEYINLPASLRRAVDLINSIQYRRQVKVGGPQVVHVVGYEPFAGQQALRSAGYGNGPPLTLGPLPSDKVSVFGLGCGEAVFWPACTPFWPGTPACNPGWTSEEGYCMTNKEWKCARWGGNVPKTSPLPCKYCDGVLAPPMYPNSDYYPDGDNIPFGATICPTEFGQDMYCIPAPTLPHPYASYDATHNNPLDASGNGTWNQECAT